MKHRSVNWNTSINYKEGKTLSEWRKVILCVVWRNGLLDKPATPPGCSHAMLGNARERKTVLCRMRAGPQSSARVRSTASRARAFPSTTWERVRNSVYTQSYCMGTCSTQHLRWNYFLNLKLQRVIHGSVRYLREKENSWQTMCFWVELLAWSMWDETEVCFFWRFCIYSSKRDIRL